MPFRQFLIILIFVALCAHKAHAKCAAVVIEVQGIVATDRSDTSQQPAIRLVSSPDANWNNADTFAANKEFKAILYFDTTRSAGHFRHKCSREPQFVEVVLMQKGVEVERAKLQFPTDFKETSPGHYENLVGVILGDVHHGQNKDGQ